MNLMSFNLQLVPEPEAWPISAIAGLQTTLDAKLVPNNVGATYFDATFTGSGLPAKLCHNTSATASHPSNAELGGQFTLYATGGLANKPTAYKIALTSSVVATPNAADIYALNTIAHGFAGTGGHLITGIESDVNNMGVDALTLGAANAAYGVVAVCSGQKKSTAAFWATSVTQWQYGFAASNTAGSSVGLATFYDETQADNILLSHTLHDHGINLYAASFSTGNAFIAPNNSSYAAANAAGSGPPKNLIKLDAADTVVLSNGTLSIKAATEFFIPAISNAAYCGYPGFLWKSVHTVNGVSQTSDLRDKTDREPIDGELALSILRDVANDPDGLITYRWIVGGNELEEVDGEIVVTPVPGRRRHAGFGAQVWDRVLASHDLDIGLLVREDPCDPDSRLSLRSDQTVPFLHAAIVALEQRLEAALTTIESLNDRISQIEGQ